MTTAAQTVSELSPVQDRFATLNQMTIAGLDINRLMFVCSIVTRLIAEEWSA